MFDKEEGKERRKAFWTAFGQHMQQHLSARGPKQKWVNYRTGVRHLYFRLEADKRRASVTIDLQHRDEGIRELFFQQWEELRNLLHNATETEWIWEENYFMDTGLQASRIYVFREPCNIYLKEDWEGIITWMEKHLLALDEIWSDAFDIFKDLEK